MRRLILALMGLLFIPALAPSPAIAGPLCNSGITCGQIDHVNDVGYDADIVVFCNYSDAFNDDGTKNIKWERAKFVKEGYSSKSSCRDVDVVLVRSNEQISCRTIVPRTGTVSWRVVWDAAGPHKITDNVVEDCVVQRD